MIQLTHVTLHRGAGEVLRQVSLKIPRGRITAVVGRSGVGKSTLIGALNGLLTPSAGEIAVSGIGALDSGEALRRHRLRTATVFQDHALIERLSALDNVLLGLADRRHPLSPLPWPMSFRQQAAQALAQVGLLHRAQARVDRLSGGEKQRVGVARALVRQPSLLLGDEPFASVDPGLIRQMGDTLRQQVNDSGLTVVLVMHQLDAALSIADKVIALADGAVAFDGAASEFDAAARVRLFGNVSDCTRLSPEIALTAHADAQSA